LETIKFFKVKIYEEEEEIKLKIKRNMKLTSSEKEDLFPKKLTSKTNQVYNDSNRNYKNTIDKQTMRKKDFEILSVNTENSLFEKNFRKSLYPPRKKSFNCVNENIQMNKISSTGKFFNKIIIDRIVGF